MNIFEDIINNVKHGLEYITPTSMGLFEDKHHTLTSEFEMQDPSSQQSIMHWITSYIVHEGEVVTCVS